MKNWNIGKFIALPFFVILLFSGCAKDTLPQAEHIPEFNLRLYQDFTGCYGPTANGKREQMSAVLGYGTGNREAWNIPHYLTMRLYKGEGIKLSNFYADTDANYLTNIKGEDGYDDMYAKELQAGERYFEFGIGRLIGFKIFNEGTYEFALVVTQPETGETFISPHYRLTTERHETDEALGSYYYLGKLEIVEKLSITPTAQKGETH